MTTETNTVFDTVKEAFAPVTDAFKNLQNMEVPEAARDFVKRSANTAKERAADVYAGSEKVTAAIETAGEIVEREALATRLARSRSSGVRTGALAGAQASIGLGGWIKALGMWLSSGSVIAQGAMQPTWTEDRAPARMLA